MARFFEDIKNELTAKGHVLRVKEWEKLNEQMIEDQSDRFKTYWFFEGELTEIEDYAHRDPTAVM